ncbi:hypothetical protein JOB18_000944 [Solea senegalensis]|uniref:Uncharacterized protein n=1 Tax=Solea senegalensis TaxID=28829 RepID=A0AAV6R166_SOLSE|nr:hypothetical protein JOB18_000944 [Solea senegalensis]
MAAASNTDGNYFLLFSENVNHVFAKFANSLAVAEELSVKKKKDISRQTMLNSQIHPVTEKLTFNNLRLLRGNRGRFFH